MTDLHPTDGPIHTHFGLSYANYLVLPRTLLQSMPIGWQERMVACLDELDDAFQHVPQADGYDVTAGEWKLINEMTDRDLVAAGIQQTRDYFDENDEPTDGPLYHRAADGAELTGQDYGFVPGADPVPHYNRGRTYLAPAA